jgi:hypothetical protein
MKKSVFAIMAIAMLGMSTFVACNKRETVQKPVNDNAKMQIMSTSSICSQANFNEVDFGAAHNSAVIALYKGVDFSNLETARQHVIENFIKSEVNPQPLGLTQNEYYKKSIEMVNNLAAMGYDFRNNQSSTIRNAKYFPYIVRILNEIDGIGNSLQTFNGRLDGIQNDAIQNLECLDRDVVLGSIKIAKSSAQLWASTAIGGEGLFDRIDGNGLAMPMGWRGALIGDVSGSAQYFAGLGIGAAVGWAIPGANVAILGGWALAAGLASGCGAMGF